VFRGEEGQVVHPEREAQDALEDNDLCTLPLSQRGRVDDTANYAALALAVVKGQPYSATLRLKRSKLRIKL
jgi:hypothetical protein